ncbi:hypothetical protein [Bradyrhizobium stylosanthis]|uniref:Uncharacterized protein n=1 Tax=Bradyrhizobium stylosanthis TaxID=1803665 RepID=A0A560EC57_9BRAD|nr:hypothetical protein [Bradyrhizobium stylosanthis]TWB06900.1 hypothetical protein FBZ96_101715 [Bradyrhizobium stylosanthis]
MSKVALTFSASVAIISAFLSSIFGKFPDWVTTNILGAESTLHYVVSSELRYDLLACGLLIALSPQLLWLARFSLLFIARLTFHASYCLVTPRKLTGLFLLSGLLACGLSAGFFVQALSTYGYAVSREYTKRDEINRARLIEQANSLGRTDLLASISLLKRLIGAYPEDQRNDDLKRYLQRFSDAKDSSDQLVSTADGFAAKNSHLIAIQFYRLAAAVFPANRTASDRLSSYKEKLESARPSLQQFFELCKDPQQLPLLVGRSEEFGFAIKEPQSVKRLRLSPAGEGGNRAYLQICGNATHYRTFDEYFSDLQVRIFDPKSNS